MGDAVSRPAWVTRLAGRPPTPSHSIHICPIQARSRSFVQIVIIVFVQFIFNLDTSTHVGAKFGSYGSEEVLISEFPTAIEVKVKSFVALTQGRSPSRYRRLFLTSEFY